MSCIIYTNQHTYLYIIIHTQLYTFILSYISVDNTRHVYVYTNQHTYLYIIIHTQLYTFILSYIIHTVHLPAHGKGC